MIAILGSTTSLSSGWSERICNLQFASLLSSTSLKSRLGEVKRIKPSEERTRSARWMNGLQITVANSWPNYSRNKGHFNGLRREFPKKRQHLLRNKASNIHKKSKFSLPDLPQQVPTMEKVWVKMSLTLSKCLKRKTSLACHLVCSEQEAATERTSAILNVCSLSWPPFLTQSLPIPTASSVWISLGVEWSACFHAFIHSVLPVLLGSLPIVAGPLVQSVVQMQTVEKSAHSFVMLLSHRALKSFVRNMVQRYASSSKRLFESTGSFQMTRSWSLVSGMIFWGRWKLQCPENWSTAF